MSTPSNSKNYPIADPNWDYVETWTQVTSAHKILEQLMKFMSSEECEEESDQATRYIKNQIQLAIMNLEEAADWGDDRLV